MKQIVEYDVTEVAIEAMSKQYMPLVITDIDDKEQFDAVRDARMVVKGKRVEVEKKRKELKADALAWGKKVDGEAKRIFNLLEPIENHLQVEENKVIQEKERIKAEEERLEKEKIQSRVDALGKYKLMLPFFDVAAMTDEEFEAKLAQAKEVHEAELKRMKEEEETRIAEDARIAKEREELAKIREEQEKQAKIQADKEDALEKERRALEDEKRRGREQSLRDIGVFRGGFAGESLECKFEGFVYAGPTLTWIHIVKLSNEEFAKLIEDLKKQIAEFGLKAKEDARIKVEKIASDKAERERKEKADREEAEELEAAQQEALKPDKEKLIAWAETIASLVAPEVQDAKAKVIAENSKLALDSVAEHITAKAEEM